MGTQTLDADIQKSEAALQRTLPDAILQVTRLPTVEVIQLALINQDYQTGPLPADIMHAVTAKPAYWAFCWGSGLALARWLLENSSIVANKRVADVGCGCGVGAIAAKLAGAAHVVACDSDEDALLNARANAELNQVALTFSNNVNELDDGFDLVLMADVLYDKSNYPLLETVQRFAAEVIVADSRIATIEHSAFQLFQTSEALTHPNLGEFDEFSKVRFFRASSVLASHP